MICKKCNDETSIEHDRGMCFACYKETTLIELAAPELLEALKQLADYGDKTVQEICDQDTGWYYQLKSALNKAEQAIAKATNPV